MESVGGDANARACGAGRVRSPLVSRPPCSRRVARVCAYRLCHIAQQKNEKGRRVEKKKRQHNSAVCKEKKRMTLALPLPRPSLLVRAWRLLEEGVWTMGERCGQRVRRAADFCLSLFFSNPPSPLPSNPHRQARPQNRTRQALPRVQRRFEARPRPGDGVVDGRGERGGRAAYSAPAAARRQAHAAVVRNENWWFRMLLLTCCWID